MEKKSEFELRQHQRCNWLKSELNIVEKGRKGSKGTPLLTIHQMRIEEAEKFLGLR